MSSTNSLLKYEERYCFKQIIHHCTCRSLVKWSPPFLHVSYSFPHFSVGVVLHAVENLLLLLNDCEENCRRLCQHVSEFIRSVQEEF